MPGAPGDIAGQKHFEDGVAPHPQSLILSPASFRDAGRKLLQSCCFSPSSGALRPDLAPAGLRHAFSREDGAGGGRVCRLALVLGAVTALLSGFVGGILFGIDGAAVVDEAQGLGFGIARVEWRK